MEESIQLTKKSTLIVKHFEDENLLKLCVEEVKEKVKKLPITMFGKPMFQPRMVGFFSNQSVGYTYSKQLTRSRPFKKPLYSLMRSYKP
jgi:alkylated DNA repair dioxygenase AlkB